MKTGISILILFFSSLFCFSQRENLENCILQLSDELHKTDTSSSNNIPKLFQNTYDKLKLNNSAFKKCSNYWSLKFDLWSKHKLTMAYNSKKFNLTPKFKELIDKGPYIYDTSSKLESKIKTQHNNTVFKEERSDNIIESLLQKSIRFSESYYNKNKKNYYSLISKNYLEFITKKEIEEKFQTLQQNIEILSTNVDEINYLIKTDHSLSTILKVKLKLNINNEQKKITYKLLALSYNNGKKWEFINLRKENLNALWLIVDGVYPIALNNKYNLKKSKKEYPANTPEELGYLFCDCMNKIKTKTYQNLLNCMRTLQSHPLFDKKEDRKKVYNTVKNNCNKYSGSIVFMDQIIEDKELKKK